MKTTNLSPPGSPQSEKSVFVICKENYFLSRIKDLLADFPDFKFESFSDVNAFMEITDPMHPFLFLIDGNLGQESVQEWTQSLRMSYEKPPLIVFHSAKTPLSFEAIRKNGANQLIHINFDREFVIELLLEIANYEFPENQIPLSALNSIDNKDLSVDLEVNFDVFIHLPFNKRTILYRKKGATLEDQKIKKIESRDQRLYFKKTERKAFLEYARTAVTLNNSENPIAETERSIKSKKLIFEFMSEFFNEEVGDYKAGRLILDRCKEIVQEYNLLSAHSPKEAFSRIVTLTGQERTFYNDAINLAAYSAMFGHILHCSTEQIESLALSGLLHNIGLSYLENYNLNQDLSTLPKEQLDLYHNYPEKSVWMIKSKRVSLPPSVSDTIIEHRENVDGTGFPNKQLSLKPLSKIVRIAYEFQTMTALSKHEEKRTATNALAELRDKVLAGQIPIDLNTVLELAKVLK